MRKLSFTDSQIIDTLRRVEAGSVEDLIAQTRIHSNAAPWTALKLALSLDKDLAKLGFQRAVTVSKSSLAIAGDPHNLSGDDSVPSCFLQEVERRYAESNTLPQADLARCYLTAAGNEVPTLNLIYANQSVLVETLWLHFLNKYLSYFAPPEQPTRFSLSLERSEGHRITRLAVPSMQTEPSRLAGPKVTILMPVFNAASTLDFAVRSIIRQTWSNWELMLIDDASSDQSLALCRAWADLSPQIRVLALPRNRGPYVAKNEGLALATGDYVTVHDADDWAFPTRLSDQLSPLLNSAELKVTMGLTLRMTSDGFFTRFQPVNWFTKDGAMRWCFPSPLFERSFFESQLGAWDSVRIGADTEIVQRIRRFAPHRLKILDIPVMLQLDAPDSLTRHPNTYNDSRGEAPLRTAYRKAWNHWHGSHQSLPRLAYPQPTRAFEVPPEILP